MRKRREADAGQSVPAIPTSDTSERRIARLAKGAGVPVEDVLREVSDFRLALETDMLIAAAALDADAPEITADVVDNERRELRDLHDRLLDRLADAAAADFAADIAATEPPTTGLARARVGMRMARALATAAALVGIVGSATVVRTMSGPTVQASSQSHDLAKADRQIVSLAHASLSEGSAAAAEAAEQLHQTLQTLIDEHGTDPRVARQIVSLLTQDLALIRNKPELRGVLEQALTLAHQLSRQAPPQVRATVQPLIKAIEADTPKAKPSASPSPAKPSPSPSTVSPSPSASSSSDGSTRSNNEQSGSGGNNKGGDENPLPSPPGV